MVICKWHYSGSYILYACVQRHVSRKWNITDCTTLLLGKQPSIIEHYAEALGNSSAMVQPKKINKCFCHSEMNFLGFLSLIPDKRNKQRLVNAFLSQ